MEDANAIKDAMEAMVHASENMRQQMEQNAGRAGVTATAALDLAMKEVLVSLSAQMEAFKSALTGFQSSLTASGQKAAGNAKEIVDGTTKAAEDAAKSVRDSFGELLLALRTDTERVSVALTSAEQTFSRVAGAAKDTVDQSNAAASAFGRVAEKVQESSRPLLESAGRIEGAVDRLSGAVTQASASVETSHTSARTLADGLRETVGQMQQNWMQHAEKFEGADASLAAAIRVLTQETEQYQQRIREFVGDIDNNFANSVTALNTVATTLNHGVDELSDHLEALIVRVDNR